MTDIKNKIDMLWDDDPVDVTSEANFIWSIANNQINPNNTQINYFENQ